MSERKGLLSFFNIDSIIDNMSGYIENKIALLKIEIKEDMAIAGARILIMLVLALFMFMIILFLSIGAGALFNMMLGNDYLGYFIVAGFYLILFMIFGLMHKKLGIEQKFEKIILKILKNE
ncbi:MAG: phage holin family protein [Bacteroidetes bacterium]|nr:phage holin family protein [Bacteroidota bacterium]